MAIKYKNTEWGKGKYNTTTGKWVKGSGKKNAKSKHKN